MVRPFFVHMNENELLAPTHSILNINDYPNIQRLEINGKRWYGTSYDDAVPSVTTILETKGNDAIEKWKKRVGEKEAFRISKLATDKGQEFHAVIEAYLSNHKYIPVDTSPMVINMFRQIQPLLNRISNIQMLEKQLWCPTHAGTPDCIAMFDGITSIIDFKTSKAEIYPESLHKYNLQCYAYDLLWRHRYPDWYTNIVGFNVPAQYVVIAATSEIPEPQLHIFTDDYQKKLQYDTRLPIEFNILIKRFHEEIKK